MHTVGYVTRNSTKAQKKGESQVPSEFKITNKSKHNLKFFFITHP